MKRTLVRLLLLPSFVACSSAASAQVEGAIVNAMVAAETMSGIDGNTVHALPHERLGEVPRKYNRLTK